MGPVGPESQEAIRLFDKTVLMECVESDLELFRTLFEVFEQDRPGLLVAMEKALERNDGAGLEQAAHKIKGALGVFGAGIAEMSAARLERAGREGAVTAGLALFPAFEATVLKTEDQLRDFLAELENEKGVRDS